ncbi:uncharacterized protein [Dermacentor albipictus]|uniref:uncharacterized protein n=1 Tax=Dermacentor albipictus TaxID=60249 RepID=UPI0038FC5D69
MPDSIADVVATLGGAKSCGDVAKLRLLDVESAFDGFPHTVIDAAMDGLGVDGCLLGFVTGFLTGRTFWVRVGRELSELRGITAGFPQESVLSPLLLNMALAGLPASLPAAAPFPARCSIYADEMALCVQGPRRSIPAIRRSLQEALDAVVSYLGGIGLRVSAAKTEAPLIYPLASARLKAGARALGIDVTVKRGGGVCRRRAMEERARSPGSRGRPRTYTTAEEARAAASAPARCPKIPNSGCERRTNDGSDERKKASGAKGECIPEGNTESAAGFHVLVLQE